MRSAHRVLPIWHDLMAACPVLRLGESCSNNRVQASALAKLCEVSFLWSRPIWSNSFKDGSASFRPAVLANAWTHACGKFLWLRDPPSHMIKMFGVLAEALVYLSHNKLFYLSVLVGRMLARASATSSVVAGSKEDVFLPRPTFSLRQSTDLVFCGRPTRAFPSSCEFA